MTTTTSLAGALPDHASISVPPAFPRPRVPSLLDLMSDGFYLLLLLRRGQLPDDAATFTEAIQAFLGGVAREAGRLGLPAEDVHASTYAFCAAVDEAILARPSPLHIVWERNPLQLRLFGEHLAGDHLFDRLEQLRRQGVARLPSLEVYHYCLLMGFQGRYRLESEDKLAYVTARLGEEIAYLKGTRAGFAPHAHAPDSVLHALRRVIPVWFPLAAFGLIGLLAFVGLRLHLDHRTAAQMAAYNDIVKMPQRTAHVTITLP